MIRIRIRMIQIRHVSHSDHSDDIRKLGSLKHGRKKDRN